MGANRAFFGRVVHGGRAQITLFGQKPNRDRHLFGGNQCDAAGDAALSAADLRPRAAGLQPEHADLHHPHRACRAGRPRRARNRALLLCRQGRVAHRHRDGVGRLPDVDERSSRRAGRRAAAARPGDDPRLHQLARAVLPVRPAVFADLHRAALSGPSRAVLRHHHRRGRDGRRRGRQPDGDRQAGPAGGRLHDDVDEHGAVVRPQFRDGPRARHGLEHDRGVGQEVRGIDQSLGQCLAPQRVLRRAVAHAAHGAAERHHVRRRLSRAAERDDGRHDLRRVDHLGPRAAAARPDHRRLAAGHRCQPRLEPAEEHRQGECRGCRQGHRRSARPQGRHRWSTASSISRRTPTAPPIR